MDQVSSRVEVANDDAAVSILSKALVGMVKRDEEEIVLCIDEGLWYPPLTIG